MQRQYENYGSYELLHYPKSIADSDGFLKKPNKSQLMLEIENLTQCSVEFGANFSGEKKKFIYLMV